MSLFDHIENIRHKPEHVRRRYTWLCVAISMLFIIAIWIVSLQSEKQPIDNSNNLNAGEIFEQIEKGSRVIDEKIKDTRGVMNKPGSSVININNQQ